MVDGGLIDADHRSLIDIINEFESIPPSPATIGDLHGVLRKLDDYTKRHFQREEELQRAVFFPTCQEHHQMHLKMITSLDHIRSEIESAATRDLDALHAKIVQFLRSWLIGHILKSDVEMRPFAARFITSGMATIESTTRLRGLRVMLVDDQKYMRDVMKAVLKAVDPSFVVREAADGEAALRLIEEFEPELLLCDINMEPMNGLRAIECLRNHANPALRDTPVIMLTARTDEEAIRDASRLDIQGYLVKSISPKQVEARLHKIFRDRQPPPL